MRKKPESQARRHDHNRLSERDLRRGRRPHARTWLCRTRDHHCPRKNLKETGAYETYKPDIVLYDVLGDVVCGGFSMPMRKGYADKVFIITSGENMAIHAGANIAMAVQNFKNRGYATLGGIILNRRNVKREEEKVQELADDFETQIIGKLTRSDLVTDAEEQGKTLMECLPGQRNGSRIPHTGRKHSGYLQKGRAMLKRVGGEINPEGAVITIGEADFSCSISARTGIQLSGTWQLEYRPHRNAYA